MQTEESEFEKVVEALGLRPDEYLHSSVLREWVRQNKDDKYVSTELLKAWGFVEE